MANTYLYGQGRIYIAKYRNLSTGVFTKDEKKERGDFFDLGNAPHFSIKTTRQNNERGIPKEDTIRLVFENFNADTFDMIFGGVAVVGDVNNISDVGRFKAENQNSKLITTGLHTQAYAKNYALIFDGKNTANCDKPFRVELNNIYLRPSNNLEFITDNIASFEVTGYHIYHQNDCVYLATEQLKTSSDSISPETKKE